MTDEKQHKETSPASTGSGQPSIFLFSLLFIGAFGLAMGFWILANFEAKHIENARDCRKYRWTNLEHDLAGMDCKQTYASDQDSIR
jgi:hypothetical protein